MKETHEAEGASWGCGAAGGGVKVAKICWDVRVVDVAWAWARDEGEGEDDISAEGGFDGGDGNYGGDGNDGKDGEMAAATTTAALGVGGEGEM